MLSILIPTYNYNVYPLVTELKSQADALGIAYEVLQLMDKHYNCILELKPITSISFFELLQTFFHPQI